MFNIYATGRYSCRDVAQCSLSASTERRTATFFCANTVRDMIGNLSYCGFVTSQGAPARRSAASTSRSSPRSCSIAAPSCVAGARRPTSRPTVVAVPAAQHRALRALRALRAV
jgi:hypothetical protein